MQNLWAARNHRGAGSGRNAGSRNGCVVASAIPQRLGSPLRLHESTATLRYQVTAQATRPQYFAGTGGLPGQRVWRPRLLSISAVGVVGAGAKRERVSGVAVVEAATKAKLLTAVFARGTAACMPRALFAGPYLIMTLLFGFLVFPLLMRTPVVFGVQVVRRAWK